MKRFTLMFVLLASCDTRPNQWDAFVYPDANDLSGFEEIAGFKTFELCQAAAIDRMRKVQKPTGGDYECGFKCVPDPKLDGLNVCQETRK